MAGYNFTFKTESPTQAEVQDWLKRGFLPNMEPHVYITIALSVVGILFNLLSLLALLNAAVKFRSHHKLVMSLLVSDMLIGATVLAFQINRYFIRNYKAGVGPSAERLLFRCTAMIAKALNNTALNIQLMSLMGMAVDLFTAIIAPLHHPLYVAGWRVPLCIVTLWFLSTLAGFSDFFSGIAKYPKYRLKYNYCEFVWKTKYQEEYVLFAVALFCFCVMTFCYSTIYCRVTNRDLGAGQVARAAKRNRKLVVTTLCVLSCFCLSWLPMCIFQIVMILRVKFDPKGIKQDVYAFMQADKYLYIVLLTGMLINPILYAVRMPEVRKGLRRTMHKLSSPNGTVSQSDHELTRELALTSAEVKQNGGYRKGRRLPKEITSDFSSNQYE